MKKKARICPHCRKDISPGHELRDVGERMQSAGKDMSSAGCGLTLLVTVPIVLLLLMLGMCG